MKPADSPRLEVSPRGDGDLSQGTTGGRFQDLILTSRLPIKIFNKVEEEAIAGSPCCKQPRGHPINNAALSSASDS